jgi:hypothetical protein
MTPAARCREALSVAKDQRAKRVVILDRRHESPCRSEAWEL